MKFSDPQAEYDPAEPSTEDHFDRSPRLACQDIQITREGNTGQQISKKDINGRSYHELIEYTPVGGISNPKIVPILAEKAEGTKTLRKAHASTILCDASDGEVFEVFDPLPLCWDKHRI